MRPIAERAMRRAGKALGGDLPRRAIDPQTKALTHLRRGTRNMMEQIARELGDDWGFDEEDEAGAFALGRGRGEGGPGGNVLFDRGDVRIPDEMELRRAREILEELRRRASELRRSKDEREYLERLLKRF